MTSVDDVIREVLVAQGGLSLPAATLADDVDLYQSGLSSHASVNVMLGLEDALGLEFPDVLLRRGTFQSISSIRQALRTLDVTL